MTWYSIQGKRYDAASPDEARAKAQQGAPDEGSSVAGDILKSAGTGVLHGLADVAALPGNLLELTSRGLDWATGRDPSLRSHPLPTSTDLNEAISRDVGRLTPSGQPVELHQPETPAGQFAKGVSEFATAGGVTGGVGGLPGAATGAASGALSGAASETAGKVAHEVAPQFEGAARFVGGMAGGIPAAAQRLTQGAAPAMIGRRLGGATDADITAAQTLMAQARDRGIDLSWPEALHQVTGGRVDLRVLESAVSNSPGGQPIMSDFISRRGPAVRTAMAEEPVTVRGGQAAGDPAARGLAVQEGSNDAIRNLQLTINRATRGDYAAAETGMLSDRAYTELMRDPLYRRQIEEIRNDDVYSRSVAGLPDRSIGMLDAVQKRLSDRATNLQGGEATLPYEASQYQGTARQAVREGTRASPEYAAARTAQADLRNRYLNPAQEGPLGAMGRTSDIQAQSRALFPRNPPEGSEVSVARTIRLLNRRNPQLANDLVATHLEEYFNDAVARTTAGPEAAGATAARNLVGNPQAERNLEVAVRALPDGATKWQSLQVLLRVFQASGKRMGLGSPTEPRTRIAEEMAAGTLPGRAAETAVAGVAGAVTGVGSGVPATLAGMRLIGDWWKQFSQGARSADLARIIIDPDSAPLLRRLLTAQTLGERAQITAALLARSGAAQGARDDTGGPGGGPLKVYVGAPAPGYQ